VADLKARSLGGRGTDESVWMACSELRRLGPCSVKPPDSGRVVVIAPHPDDEVLGAGGTTAALALRGAAVVVIAVTDGEASAPERVEELRRVRPKESARAAATLGTTPSLSYALGLPDGRVRADDVEALVVSLLEPGDLVLAPWAHDGHPDHDEVGWAAQRACAEVGARLLAYLVWAWHWAQPGELPWEKACRVELDDAVAWRKRKAVQCFASQLTGFEPILSSHTVRRLTRDFEVFLSP
jgi:LmbE family N-acetylglucosaminyl deacetylase